MQPAAPTRYAPLRPQRGHAEALGIVKHSIIVVAFHMRCTGELHNDLGGDYCRLRETERATRRPIARLQALGQPVTPQDAVAA